MASKNPFASPNANKSLPPTPHSRSQSLASLQTPLRLKSETSFDPFLDSASPPSPSRNEVPPPRLPHKRGLPREETFQSTTESLGGITGSVGNRSEYETEYGYTEPDLYHASRAGGFSSHEMGFDTEGDLHVASGGYTQCEMIRTEGDLYSAAQSHVESDLQKATVRYSQPDLHFSDVDFNGPSHELGQTELIGSGRLSPPSADIETPPIRRPIRVTTEDVNILLLPHQPKFSSKKRTLNGTYFSESTLASDAENPFGDPLRINFSSPATDVTPVRALPNAPYAPYTPSNLGTHPALRHLARGCNSQGNASTFSLNREVRLREAAKQQDALLLQERANEDRTRVLFHSVPTLRPSPVALKVAAQLIRDSPAGKLPIGPQAVLRSKTFWSGLSIFQIGLISMTAAITNIAHDGDIYQNGPEGGTESTFWLTISIVALLGGGIVAAITFLRKMGYWIDKQQLLGLDEVGLVDRLLRRDRTPRREAELGTLPGSVQTFASATTTPRPRQGLYATQGRFNYSTFNSLNPEWQELYMTPEQLRQKISPQHINTVVLTPSKLATGGASNANGLISSGPSLEDFNQTSPEPLQPAFFHPPDTPNPFQTFPEPRTPYIPALTSFSPPSVEDSINNTHNTNTTRENVRVEVDNWSPLENLTRDINSEHVRNMPMQLRHEYITEKRLRSEDRARKIREGLERGSIRSASDVTSMRPETISEIEERRGRPRGPTTPFKFLVPEAQKGEVVGEDGFGVEMEDLELNAATTMSSARKIEGEAEERHGRRRSGGSVEKMKKMLSKGKTGLRELDGRNVGKGVREEIERLREQSERTQQQ